MPRLVVNKSNVYHYAQIIDHAGKVLAQYNDLKESKSPKTESAKNVGLWVAKKAVENWIDSVVFDRNGYIYHWRIAKIAEWAREGGLKF